MVGSLEEAFSLLCSGGVEVECIEAKQEAP